MLSSSELNFSSLWVVSQLEIPLFSVCSPLAKKSRVTELRAVKFFPILFQRSSSLPPFSVSKDLKEDIEAELFCTTNK